MQRARYIPEGYNSVTPYLVVKDAKAAIEFYKQAFGARLVLKIEAPGGKLGHVEMKIGNSHIMFADEYPQEGHRSPTTLGGTPTTLLLYVEDVDHVAKLASDAGMKTIRPIKDQFYGDRSGIFEDPFGHTWAIATHIEDVSEEEMKKRAEKLFGSCG